MPSSRHHAPLLALLLVLPLPAAAETLYKCIDPAGLTSIQMAPCAKGSKQVWARESAPEPPPTPEQVAAAQARAQERERLRAEEEARLRDEEQARKVAATPPPAEAKEPPAPPPPPDPCDEAKLFAAQVRAKPWLGMNPDQMQRLYGWVAQECGATAE